MSALYDKTVLVTGGGGFLGGYVLSELIDNHPVTRVFTSGSRADCDLRDPADVAKLFHRIRPDVVIHLAADVGGIGDNLDRPADLFWNNILMGINVIASCAENNTRLVFAGTTCAYPADCPVPFCEDSLWDGYPEISNAPYGIAKRSLLTAMQASAKQRGLRWAYPILANLYGPNDNFNLSTSHVIPALIRKIVTAQEMGKPVVCWGTGLPTRDFLHARDAAKGIVLMACCAESGLVVNFGSGMERSIRDTATSIAAVLKYEEAFGWDKTKPDGQKRRCLDITKAKALGWSPKVDFDSGLSETISFLL